MDSLDHALSRLAGELAVSNAILSMRLYGSRGERRYLERASGLLDQADQRGADTSKARRLLACYSL